MLHNDPVVHPPYYTKARCTSPLAAIKADFKERGIQPYLTLSGYVV
jgi:hypothetical protein